MSDQNNSKPGPGVRVVTSPDDQNGYERAQSRIDTLQAALDEARAEDRPFVMRSVLLSDKGGGPDGNGDASLVLLEASHKAHDTLVRAFWNLYLRHTPYDAGFAPGPGYDGPCDDPNCPVHGLKN
jgi:hypothetical protein